MILSIDIETYSAVDLTRSTVYRYSEDPSFEILLFGYAIDDGPVTVLDLTEKPLPPDLITMIMSPDVIKQAYNANFERVCLSRYLCSPQSVGKRGPLTDDGFFLDPEQWRCTMVHALTCGLPRSLKDVGAALGLPEDKAKLKTGDQLIRYFCKPCKATKKNAMRTRNIPENDPEKWELFKEYNRRDVEVERTIRKILDEKPVPDIEWRAYWLDQRINDRGVLCDRKLVEQAILMSKEHTEDLTREAIELTGIQNPNSVAQLKAWLGVEGSLDKKAIAAMRDSGQLDLKQDRLLAIRQEMGKTSISKYEAMQRGMCNDNRIRGLFQFYGASRTGRWAGRQVQVQNLPQNKISRLDSARSIVLEGDRFSLQCLFGNVPDTLSQLIRTAFTAEPGRTFAVCDFSAIEARVLAWIAGEQWRMDVFREGKDIYCASASQMFRVPVEKHGVNGHLRQKGKIAELALGYGGSVGALKAMGALEMGLTEDELKPLVDVWRGANPSIVRFWWDVDSMVRAAISSPGVIQKMPVANGRSDLLAVCSRRLLSIRLPSGRAIRYWQPGIEIDDTGKEVITYKGMDAGNWSTLNTYGPKLVENIVQATSRDCLRDAMYWTSKKFPDIVMHVHDEMIVEVWEEQAEEALEWMQTQMALCAEAWAPGLLLRGDGYITKYYRKD
jgi:DNA polymerase